MAAAEPTTPGDVTVRRRAAVHAALGEPIRLAIVDHLAHSDRSPKEIGERLGLTTNLVAHHLEVLESVGLIDRFVSAGDRRRRYVRLVRAPLDGLVPSPFDARPPGRVLFVCTHNSARSQLAAAAWRFRTGAPADSAGTHPAERVHPGAVAAAGRAGLDLGDARPRLLSDVTSTVPAGHDLVVTVCDRAHEEVDAAPEWWHWSIPDPVDRGTDEAFDDVLHTLHDRISATIGGAVAATVATTQDAHGSTTRSGGTPA